MPTMNDYSTIPPIHEEHDDNCKGCRPCLLQLDEKTGKATPYPKNHPVAVAVNDFWDTQTTLEERRAWHKVTCNNDYSEELMILVGPMMDRMSVAMKVIDPEVRS